MQRLLIVALSTASCERCESTGNLPPRSSGLILKSHTSGRRALGVMSREVTGQVGRELSVPLTILRASSFRNEAKVELVGCQPSTPLTIPPITIAPDQTEGVVTLRLASESVPAGEYQLQFRATSLQQGKWPVISEARTLLYVQPSGTAE